MSFNRPNWDSCTYKFKVNQSVDAARYGIETPRPDCLACHPFDPSVNHGQRGFPTDINGQCVKKPLIDVDSELRTLNRASSRCPVEKYLPQEKEFCESIQPLRDCRAIPNETTRISNPPCTLRGTGWNRWEWLCQNPQDKSLIPFDYNVSSRTVIKDNHRPCLDVPINQSAALPPLNNSDDVYVGPTPCQYGAMPNFTSLHWRQDNEMDPYVR
jgi:hypothetical protein